MAITRAQQAKQMLQNGGMLVQPGFGGTRQGYRGDDAAKAERARSPSGKNTSRADERGSVERDTGLERARQRTIKLTGGLKETKPTVNFPKYTPTGFIADTFLREPLQKFADFTAAKNRPFFIDEVVRAGKIKGLNFGTVSDMTEEELEDAYKDYMSSRMAGEIDAYGNQLSRGDGERSIPLISQQGIMAQAPSIMDQEPEEEGGLRLAFRANGGRIGFQGGGADLGTASSRDFGFGDRDARDDAAINRRMQNIGAGGGGGGGKGPVIKEKPPVNIVKEKSNLQKIMDIFGLGSDDDQTGVSQKTVDTVLNPDAAKNFEKLTTQTGSLVSQDTELMKSLGLAKAEGGRIGLMEGGMPYEGGIMDLESARQMYGLGKLVKKVTRTVKKIAKSPIGKAALLYAGTAGLGAFGAGAAKAGSGFGIFSPGNVFKNIVSSGKNLGLLKRLTGVGKDGTELFSRVGPLSNLGIGSAIMGTSLAAGFLTPEQEEEAQRISDETGIDIAEIRANPNKYLATRFMAEGGRIGLKEGEGIMKMASAVGDETDEISKEMFGKSVKDLNPSELEELREYLDNLRTKFMAEGGSMKEPVAKKTMPLLDMDGKEMDLRAEGGFVPIGRMEKADDVPARLSKNEFVFTADAVRNAGDGDVDKGAEVMYNMMKNLESGGEVSEESQGLEGARNMFQTSKRLEEVI